MSHDLPKSYIGTLVVEKQDENYVQITCWLEDETHSYFAHDFFEDIKFYFIPLDPDAKMLETIPERKTQSLISSENTSESLSIEDARKILENFHSIKKIYKDYSLKTALGILNKLYDSWIESNRGVDVKWGPKIISETSSKGGDILSSTTIGRYLGVFRRLGINEIKVEVKGEEEIIPIPHRFR